METVSREPYRINCGKDSERPPNMAPSLTANTGPSVGKTVAIIISPKTVKEADLLYIAGSVTLLELAGLP